MTAPLLGGWLMTAVGMASVFFDGAFAFTGVLTFLAVLLYDRGAGALAEW